MKEVQEDKTMIIGDVEMLNVDENFMVSVEK